MAISFSKIKTVLAETDTMPCGKYVGTPLKDIPKKYLLWMHDNGYITLSDEFMFQEDLNEYNTPIDYFDWNEDVPF
jgi:hypothetical protein